jgi:hypothetical protein
MSCPKLYHKNKATNENLIHDEYAHSTKRLRDIEKFDNTSSMVASSLWNLRIINSILVIWDQDYC